MLSAEMRLLIAGCRTDGRRDDDRAVDPDRLLRLARYHRVCGLVWDTRQRLDLPAAVLPGLEREAQSVLRRNLAQEAACRQALRCLEPLGIHVVLLKGILLLQTVYRCPSHRPLSDVDLLVRPEDLPGVVDILATAGYQSPPYAAFSLRADQEVRLLSSGPPTVALDIHTDLNRPTRHHGFPTEDIWSRVTPVPGFPDAARAMAPADHLVFLCTHAVPHAFSQLIWLNDIATMANTYGSERFWTDVQAAASAARARRATAAGLALAKQLLGAEVPDEVLEGLAGRHRERLERRLTAERVFGAGRYSTAASLHWRMALSDTRADSVSILVAVIARKVGEIRRGLVKRKQGGRV